MTVSLSASSTYYCTTEDVAVLAYNASSQRSASSVDDDHSLYVCTVVCSDLSASLPISRPKVDYLDSQENVFLADTAVNTMMVIIIRDTASHKFRYTYYALSDGCSVTSSLVASLL